MAVLNSAQSLGQMAKNPPNIRIEKKIVKLTNYTSACNSWTNFEYDPHAMTGNGNYVNLLKLGRKNS